MPFAKRILPLTVLWCAMARIRWRIPPLHSATLFSRAPSPVLTGSQKPINMDITDSKTNLLDSFVCACDGRIPGVQVVFGGAVILGTRARKTYSKSFGAFSSINYPVLGVVQDNCLVPYIRRRLRRNPCFMVL